MTELHLDPGGPRSGDDTRQIAHGLAECIRVLNHHTMDAEALPYPNTIYDVLGSLHSAVGGLDQLLRQLDQRLVRFAQSGQLASSNGDAFAHVNTALRQIAGLRTDAAVMSERLARAFNATSGLYLREEESDR